MERRDNNYYDVRAKDVTLEDITSSAHNADILRRLRDNDLASTEVGEGALYIMDYDSNCDDSFFVKEGDDWGWLGYFIGRNKHIRDLHLYCLPKDRDQVGAFMKGVKDNRSIQCFDFSDGVRGDVIIDSLVPFIIHNANLKELCLRSVDLGLDCAHSLAEALNKREEKYLTRFSFRHNNLSHEALEEIIAALSGYKQLVLEPISEEMIGRDQKYYDMLAQIIDLNCITSSKKNAEIFRKLRDDAWEEKEDLRITQYDYDYDEFFCAGEDDDWGWLGYFVGRNKQIRGLHLYCLPEEEDEVDAFMEGLCRNYSIERIDARHCEIDFSSLSPFIINSRNLRSLELWNVDISLENASSLAIALNRRQRKSLATICLWCNNLRNEALEEISAALTGYPYLETFNVSENVLVGANGCESLGAIIRSSALRLEQVSLCGNDFDDNGLQTLTAALTNAATLQRLSLSSNRSMTASGLRALSQLFSSACPVETLLLEDMNIGDEGAEALADGLMGNTTLKHLVLTPDSAGITGTGWAAFSRLLCDTSSINNTYSSNHTLEHIGDDYCFISNRFYSGGEYSGEYLRGIPSDIVNCLETNKEYQSLQDAAKIKIGRCHTDIPVEGFFECKLKFLPLLVSWFVGFGTRKCSNCQNATTREFQRRELSTVYKFIRGMPMLAVD
ncbi:leucine-rich repeat protein, partial [Skeletonema marinoi]